MDRKLRSRCSVRRHVAGAAVRKSCWSRHGIPFEVIDVTSDRQARAALVERANWRTVPVIFVDGKPIGGYRELAALLNAGALAHLTKRA